MPCGFWGKILEVDLKAGTLKDIVISKDDYRKYLGGSGLAAKMLYGELDTDVDPLDERNPVAIMAGLLTGTIAPASSRHVMCARSPLTGIWDESAAGGYWGAMFRRTGYDGIIIRNKSEKPVYLWITDEKSELRDASHLWGKDTYESDEVLRTETENKAKTACIGPAGEKMVRFASVTHEGNESHSAGRGGIGAIWGSKNLKAIVVFGKKKIEIYNREKMTSDIKSDAEQIKELSVGMTAFGTAGGVVGVESWGDLPIKNWQLGSFAEGAQKITGQTTLTPEMYLDKHHTCHACPIRCGKSVKIDEGPYAGLRSNKPEYETLAGFGSNCMNDNWEVIAVANDKCNRYGIDTISTSGCVAFAMECYEHGIITDDDTLGLPMEWGSADAIIGMVDLIAERKGIGDLLAEGSARAAEELGGLAPEFVVDSKGMELACHDPRAFTSMAVNYATAVRGGCHLEALTYFYGRGKHLDDLRYLNEPRYNHGYEGSARLCYDFQNYMGIFNPLGLCKFLFPAEVGPKMISRWISNITGWDMDMDELMTTAERIFNLKRMYNFKLGISRKDDTLSPRILAEPRPDGWARGVVPYLGKMLSEYYQLRGWTKLGVPTVETLDKLGLS